MYVYKIKTAYFSRIKRHTFRIGGSKERDEYNSTYPILLHTIRSFFYFSLVYHFKESYSHIRICLSYCYDYNISVKGNMEASLELRPISSNEGMHTKARIHRTCTQARWIHPWGWGGTHKLWAGLVEGFSVSLQQTNTKLTQKIQVYVLVWC
jgi:hypothetical protein